MAAPPDNTGLKRLYNSLIFSINGLRACYKTEQAFRQEVWLSCFFIPTGLWIGDGMPEKLLLVGAVLLVLIVELLNTAVERAIDRISFEKHNLSKEAKDMGSAAVLITLILAGTIWLLVVGSKFLP